MYIATKRARLESREAGLLVSNRLEQLEFKLEKIVVIQKHAGKVRKYIINILYGKQRVRKQIQIQWSEVFLIFEAKQNKIQN